MKDKGGAAKNRIVLFLLVIIIIYFSFYGSPEAKVTGPCSNCHTMHDSQDGTFVARGGSGMGWNGSGQLTGGSDQGPQGTLLVTTCIGCHTSTTGNTIINIGGCNIPIVFNTGGYPAQPLAGGNFFWISQGTAYDNRGHNVFGLRGSTYAANADSRLTIAPGRQPSCASYNSPVLTSCHQTLANNNDMINGPGGGGCRGCHVDVSHHVDNGKYRFLSAEVHYAGGYVTGVGDPNWEQNPASGHNWYQGTTAVYNSQYGNGLTTTHSITAFCSGCHNAFHGTSFGTYNAGPYGTDYTGMVSSTTDYSSGIWIRHPTDIALPTTGEFAAYDPVAAYNPAVPVAWANLNTVTPSSSTGPVVMCLSCHRAHASQYPSMLRFDYTTMVAGGGGSGGCFVCHSQKN